MKKRGISIFGMGYVGMVYTVGFASKGFPVVGFDVDKEKMKLLASGFSPIYEPGISGLITDCVEKGFLKIANRADEAVLGSDVTFCNCRNAKQR